jgi:thioredoxin-related protein
MFRQTFFSVVILFFSTTLMSQEENSVRWTDMQSAINNSQTNGKIIFVDVYTTWCGWCIRMDQTTFKDEAVVKMLNERFVSVKFNAEGSDTIVHNDKTYSNPNPGRSRSTHGFTYALLGQRFGYPSFAFMDAQGKVIGVLPGYQNPSQLLSVLTYFYTEAYLKSSYDEWSKAQNDKE